MGFNNLVTDLLKKPLDMKHVKTLEHGSKADYITGWHAISEANRVFGFGSWNLETVYCREVCRTEVKVGKQQSPGFKVGYEAKVSIEVIHGDGVVTRHGTGFGSNTARDLCDAIENAAKEAETDATKRALRTFGNIFGLALYDKTKKNVGNVELYDNEQAAARIKQDKLSKDLQVCETVENLRKCWIDNAKDSSSIKLTCKDMYNDLKFIYENKIKELNK